jgi:micrococcal nuclease
MRNLITLVVIAGFLSAVNFVYAQNNTLASGKQLAKVWERSSQKTEGEGIIEGNAVLVFDGDTIGIVAKNGTRYTIRLRGIDAPENRQPFGRESADQLAYLVQGMNVVAVVGEKDLNNRYLGAVFLEGEDVSLSQIRKGMAWSYGKNGVSMSKEQKEAFSRAEQKARTDHVGLWASPDPIAPWVFRGENDGGPDEIKSASNGSALPTKGSPEDKSKTTTSSGTVKSSTTATSRKYMVGPRGGCYYLNENGAKVYVRNKELCTKQ